jgi:hypothetical protein
MERNDMTLSTTTNIRQDDRASFARLATKRTNNALKYIRLIGNLSNRSNYDYTSSDAKKIFTALREAIDEVESKFNKPKPHKFILEA